MTPADSATIVRPKRSRQVAAVLVSLLVFGAIPGIIAVGLLVSGGAGGAIAAGVIALASVGLLGLVVITINQQWIITADVVERRRKFRPPQVWQRSGLGVDAVTTPQYYRGIRAGTSRVLLLSGPAGTARIDVGIYGPDGLTALVAALRPPRPRRGKRSRRVDERIDIDHDAIARYRRWRWKWRLIGIAATFAAIIVADLISVDRVSWVWVALVSAAVVTPAYVIFSFVQQAVRRPSGPVPQSVRVTDTGIQVAPVGTPTEDVHAWPDLERVEVSADLQEEGILRLILRSGDPIEYSLTGRVGGDFRDDVMPDLERLADALLDAGEPHGVPVVELQR